MTPTNSNDPSLPIGQTGTNPSMFGGVFRKKIWYATLSIRHPFGMQRPFMDPLVLLVAAASLALVANYASPKGIPLIPAPKRTAQATEYLAMSEAVQLWNGGAAIFLDAREAADYKAGHIGNAFNLPALSFAENYGEIAPLLSPNSELVLYCDGEECDLSHRLAASLHAQGHTNLHLLFNGWTAWRAAGLPTSKEGTK